MARERLTYDRAARQVTYRSDKSEGPTAGTETADPLEFLARVLTHIPDKGQVTTRYYGWYANRPRGMRRRRIETRTYRLVPAAAVLADRAEWTDLQSVGCVDATRHYVSGPKAGTTEQHRRYFITSLKARVAPFAHAVRSHWQIENACHWPLDVVFDEDQNRARRDAGPKNLATLRRWALSLMRQDTTQTTGLKGRRLIAGWNPDYLLHLLRIAMPDTDTNS